MNIENYINLAKTKNNIKSNNQLAKSLGISGASLSLFLQGKSTPSPETIIKLGELSGIDGETVFLDYLSEKYKKYRQTSKIIDNLKNRTKI